MDKALSENESFEYALRNFASWLEVLKMEPVELCNTWGNYNVAWELVADIKADGNALLILQSSYLTAEQKQEVRDFLDGLINIPKSLFVAATSVTANQEIMSHPCWEPYKKSASRLLQILQSAIARNKEYFSHQ